MFSHTHAICSCDPGCTRVHQLWKGPTPVLSHPLPVSLITRGVVFLARTSSTCCSLHCYGMRGCVAVYLSTPFPRLVVLLHSALPKSTWHFCSLFLTLGSLQGPSIQTVSSLTLHPSSFIFQPWGLNLQGLAPAVLVPAAVLHLLTPFYTPKHCLNKLPRLALNCQSSCLRFLSSCDYPAVCSLHKVTQSPVSQSTLHTSSERGSQL